MQAEKSTPIIVGNNNTSEHFKSHFEGAGKFLDLMHKGDDLKKSGNYAEAIEVYKQGLEQYAYSRPEQAGAMDSIAMTYEEMGNFDEAAKYYDLASEVTMNENRRASLSQKATTLYQKSREISANHGSE